MSNDEVKQFFIDNGSYTDFKIVNTPVFMTCNIITNDTGGLELVSSTHIVETFYINDIRLFIHKYLNNTNQWYIYNDTITDFNTDMKYIRCNGIESDDYVKLKQRIEKINKLKQNIYGEKIRRNRFLHT